MRVLYALICEHAEMRDDGRLDAHGIFHQLYAPGFPASQDRLVVAIAIEWDVEGPGRRDFTIDLIDPSDSPSLTIRGHTDVTPRNAEDAPPRTLLVMPMDDIVFPVAGTYLFQLSLEEDRTPLAPLHLIHHEHT